MSPRPSLLLLNAKLIPYEDARVHVLSSAFKYGIAVYEGLRAYANSRTNELYGFRLREHFERLLRSMKVARMSTTFSAEDFQRQLIDLVRANKLHEDLHMRVQAYVDEDDGRIGSTEPVSVAMAAIPMGRYFAKEGVHVQVSSWTRISEANLPPRIKAAANYHNSRLALLQAKADGYDDAVLLGANGKVTEGPGYTYSWSATESCARPRQPTGSSKESLGTRSCALRARTSASPWPSDRSTAPSYTWPKKCSSAAAPQRSRRSCRSTATPSAQAMEARWHAVSSNAMSRSLAAKSPTGRNGALSSPRVRR